MAENVNSTVLVASVARFASQSSSRHQFCNRLAIPSSWTLRVKKFTENCCLRKSSEFDDEAIIEPHSMQYLCVICIKAQSGLLDLILMTHDFLAVSMHAADEDLSTSPDHYRNSYQSLTDMLPDKLPSETENGINHTNGHSPSLSPASSVDSLCDSEIDPVVEVNVLHQNCLQLSMDSHAARCVVMACCKSSIFCRNLLHYIIYKYNLNDPDDREPCNKQKIMSRHLCQEPFENWDSKYFFQISLQDVSKHWLDYKWCDRIEGLVYKRIILDEAMSWLNTLGGGFSALGDYFQQHAVRAGKISVCQLKIAMEIGDPPTVIRCRLYFAQSQMQRGFLRQAKHMIRHEFQMARNLPVEDKRLLAMCHGLWSRLQYLYTKKYSIGSRTLASKTWRSVIAAQ